MEHLLKDVRHGLHTLWKHRAMSALAIFAIAIGIGTVATQFSVVRGALFRGLPVPEGDSLHHIEWAVPEGSGLEDSIAIQDLFEFQRQQSSFEPLVGYYSGTVNFRADGSPVRLNGTFISSNWLDVLRTRPALGRGFLPADDQPGAESVAILSHALWQREFGGDPGILDRTVQTNGRPTRIVGVMPPRFGFPASQEIWVPLPTDEASSPRGKTRLTTLAVLGRLRSGAVAETAEAELSAIAQRLSESFPETNKHYTSVDVVPLMREFIGPDIAGMLWTMLFAAFLVLAVACANVANLLLAQASQRTKELAVRSALGASRRRLVAQMLTEGIVLSAFGAIAGIGVAKLGIGLIWSAVEKVNPPYWMRFEIDPALLAFVVIATLLTSLMSGLVPALKATRVDVNGTLKDDARTSSSLHLGRFARLLVVGQIALSCGLLAAALLLAKVGFDQRRIDLPYEPASIYSARMALFDTDYPTAEDRAPFYRELTARLSTDPQVAGVAFSGNYRFFGAGRTQVAIDGVEYPNDGDDRPRVRVEQIGGDYFSLLASRIVDGRDFDSADFETTASPVAIVNTVFAQRFFPRESALGRRFSVGRGSESQWLTIVGVVPDLHMQGTDTTPDDGAGFYTPYAADAPKFMTILLRPRGGDPMVLADVLREHLQTLDPNLPIYESVTLAQNLEEQLRGMEIFANIFGALGIAALVLASIGVYGVMAFSVNQRRQEIGIRMALGARRGDILGMIVRQGGTQVAFGLSFGLALAFGLGQLIASFLDGIPANDPRIYGMVAVVLCVVGLLAIIAPARRAAMFSPMQALRND